MKRENIKLAGGKGPAHKHLEALYIIIVIVELVVFAYLFTITPLITVKVVAAALIALLLAGMALRPAMLRREHALHMARWRALRKIDKLNGYTSSTFADAAPTPGTPEAIGFYRGVSAVTEKIRDIISIESDAAHEDLNA